MRTETDKIFLINELEREQSLPRICLECKTQHIKLGYNICKQCANAKELRFMLWDIFDNIGKAGKFERWKLDIKHSIVREGKNSGGYLFMDIICSRCGGIMRVETKMLDTENWKPGTSFRYECSPPCRNIRRYPKQPNKLAYNVQGWQSSTDF